MALVLPYTLLSKGGQAAYYIVTIGGESVELPRYRDHSLLAGAAGEKPASCRENTCGVVLQVVGSFHEAKQENFIHSWNTSQ